MLTGKRKKFLILLFEGQKTQKEIAEEIKVSEQTLCKWKKEEEFQEEYKALITEFIQGIAGEAIHTQHRLLKARSEMVQLMTAKDILDRAGYKAEEKVNMKGAVPVVIADDITE